MATVRIALASLTTNKDRWCTTVGWGRMNVARS
jgi:hypothetical protein